MCPSTSCVTPSFLPDKAERKAACDPTRSFIVQAPAGSGKTELLTQRYLRLLATVERPEAILAITFTRKAAAEMRERILKALRTPNAGLPETQALAHAALKQAKTQNWQLLECPHRLNILTLDALSALLCQQCSHSHFTQFEVTPFSSPLYREAALKTLQALETLQDMPPHLKTLLLSLQNRYEKAIQLLSFLLSTREQWAPLVIEAHQSKAFQASLKMAQKKLIASRIQAIDSSIPLALKEALSDLLFEGNPPDKTYVWLKQVSQTVLSQKGDWRKSFQKKQGFPAPSNFKTKEEQALARERKQEASRLSETLQGIPHLHAFLQEALILPDPDELSANWDLQEAVINILPIALGMLHLVFEKKQHIDFTEVSLEALQALGTNAFPSALAESLDLRFQHILLDEFQDTSALQFKLLKRLTEEWQERDGRTVFLVGDPMQSIYRFRQAEVGYFLQCWEQGLGSLPLTPLKLSANFRTHAGLLSHLNALGRAIFPIEPNLIRSEVPFSEATAVIPDSGNDSLFYFEEASSEALLQQIHFLRAHYPNDSIALLVRSRTHLKSLIPTLRKYGVPFNASDLTPLFECSTTQDLLALTRFFIDPLDRVAAFALLRAPFCALSLKTLEALPEHSETHSLFFETNNLEMPEENTRFQFLRDTLKTHFQRKESLPFWKTIQCCWEALHPAFVYSEAEDLNIKAFFETLKTCPPHAENFLSVLTEKLKAHFVSNFDNTPQAIEIMTIHKAKGLEFDHVLLSGFLQSTRAETKPLLHLFELPLPEETLHLLSTLNVSSQNTVHDYLHMQKKHQAEAERIRLFYVAITRAKKTLTLFLKPEQKIETAFATTLRTTLKTLTSASTLKEEEPKTSSSTRSTLLRHALLSNLPETLETTKVWHGFEPETEAQSLGVFWHQLLADWGESHSPETWLLSHEKKPILLKLYASSLSEKHLESISKHLRAIWECPKGQWLLTQSHEKYIEHDLFDAKTGRTFRLDNTFVFEGARWIVDYKISPLKDSAEETLHALKRQYAPQLQTYATLFEKESHPIRLGIYAPLFLGWIECTDTLKGAAHV